MSLALSIAQIGSKANVATASTFRRDLWPSRAAAAASFAKSAYYQRWDPRVLQLWIRYGLRDLPTAVYPDPVEDGGDASVTLTTSKHQEVWTFLRPHYPAPNRRTHPDADYSLVKADTPFYRSELASTFRRLPALRPSVLYIFGAESNLSQPEDRAPKVELTGTGVGGSGGQAEGRVGEVVLEGVGHLVPMEVVGDSAERSAEWLGKEVARWVEEEEEWRVRRRKREKRDDVVVDSEWVRWMGGGTGKESRSVTAPKL